MIDGLSPDLQAALVTVRLALTTTVILLVVGAPLAWWLGHTASRFRWVIDAVVALPLVLPPTVLGFYLLLLLGEGGLGGLFEGGLAFSFSGLVVGSVLYSMPFVVQPLQDAFVQAGRHPLEAAASMGASPMDRFLTVTLPIARPGILTAVVLGFAHTVGEFGVVLMIGGSIPGQTRVLSIAIYEHVEAMDMAQAHLLSAVLLASSFVMLLAVYGLSGRFRFTRS
jgi:molybdate transport system permease protein